MLKTQYYTYPSLTLKHSTLGESGGLGLFARRDINMQDDQVVILCHFFGKLVVATEEQVSVILFEYLL
jgi:hypothetical protein